MTGTEIVVGELGWAEEPSPILPHLASDFMLWLWWFSEGNPHIDLGDELGEVICWVDNRLSFQAPDEGKSAAVLTGDNPGEAPEARAAVLGGKVLRELRLVIRRDEREFGLTLKSPMLELAAIQLPQVVQGGGEEVLYDRMFLYEELHRLLAAIFLKFAQERSSEGWRDRVLPAMRRWAAGAGDGE